MAKRFSAKRTGLILAVAALAAAPVGAVKDFSEKGKLGGSSAGMSLYGSSHAPDNGVLGNRLKSGNGGDEAVVSTVPEPANWLMMLVGFGLLGAMSRRSNPHPMRDELTL